MSKIAYELTLDNAAYIKGMRDATSEVKTLGRESEAAGPKLDRIVNIQRAQVASQIAGGLSRVAGSVRNLGSEFEEVDPEISKTLNSAATNLDRVSVATKGAADGFAIAGPKGAIAGALIAIGFNEARLAFTDTMNAYKNAEAAQQRSIVMAARLAAAQEEAAQEEAAAVKFQNDLEQEKAQLGAKYQEFRASEEERMAAERSARVARELQEAKDAADELAALRERNAAAILSPEANLKRQIAEVQASGPTDRGSLASAPDDAARRQILERGTRLLELQQQLKTLQSEAAAKAQEEAAAKAQEEAAAERKLAAEQKVAAARALAAANFDRESAILAAKIDGNDKLVQKLERQATVEQLKLDLMREQGLTEQQAAAAAERRVSMEEAASGGGRRGVRDATSSTKAREERQAAGDATREERRQRRWSLYNAATEASGNAMAPTNAKKDFGENMSKKLESIDQRLEKLGIAN